MKPFPIFSLALLALVFAVPNTAYGQQAQPSYAVLSLAGNVLSVRAVRHQVGSRTENDANQQILIEEPVFDAAAIREAHSVLSEQRPNARVLLMLTQDQGLYKAQNAMFTAPEAHLEDRAYLKSLVQAQGASHLVLVTKLRDNARLKLNDANSVGGGVLEGLGFYVDDTTNIRNLDTKDLSRGVVVPFAYLRVRLIETATMAVVAESTIRKHTIVVIPSTESTGMDIWQSMSSAEKVEKMRLLLGQGLREALPAVLAQ